MVSGSQRNDHWRSCRRIWRGSAYHRPRRYAAHSSSRSIGNICLSGSRVSDSNGTPRLFYAKSTGWLETPGVVAHGGPGFSSVGKRLLAWGSSQNRAMVGTVAAPFSEHLGGNFDYFAGVTVVSGVGGCECRGWPGHCKKRQHWKRPWARFFWFGVPIHPEARRPFGDVSSASVPLLDTS